MTIEIDDSGTGDILGPSYLGLRRIETDEIEILSVTGVKYILQKSFLEMTIHGLNELRYQGSEPIHLCKGSVFDLVREWLSQEKYLFKNASIEGRLQDALEERYNNYLEDVGVDLYKLRINEHQLHSNKALYYEKRIRICMEWVVEDFWERQIHIRDRDMDSKMFNKVIKLKEIYNKYEFFNWTEYEKL